MKAETSIKIRPATEFDIPQIVSLEKQSHTAAHWTERQYRQSVLPDDEALCRLVLVAEPSSRSDIPEPASTILGFLVARHIAPEWEVENIVVSSVARRQGIGKLLLAGLLARTTEARSQAIFLEVRESNAAARAFYEQTGFTQAGQRRHYYTNPQEDAIRYRLDLY